MSEIPARGQSSLLKYILMGVGFAVACVCLGAVVFGGYGLATGSIAFPAFGASVTPTPTPTFTLLPTLTPTNTLTPTLTLTPIPTETPTPVNSPTPVATQSLSDIAEILAAATGGEGVAEAAEYQRNEPGPHLIVLLTDKGEAHPWNEYLRPEWKPDQISKVELVGTITYTSEVVATQKYHGCGQSSAIIVSRIRRNIVVVLYEAKTGDVVSSETFLGDDPPGFPRSLHCGQYSLYGDSAPYTVIQEWLRPFITP